MNRIGRFPLVSRDEILVAFRPGARPSEGVFRTLRERGWVSKGLGLRLRRGNRLTGQLRVYSALNLDAALLARHDREKDAQRLAVKAEKQETRWAPSLQVLVQQLGATDLDELRRLRNQLVHELVPLAEDVEKARLTVKVLKDFVREEMGVLADVSADWATLQLFSDPSEIVEVQRFLAQAAILAVGDIAVLRLERFGSGSLIELLPAVAEGFESGVTSSSSHAEDSQEISSFLSRMLEPVSFDSDLSIELKSRRAAGDVIRLPRRRIRLAG